MRQNNLWSTENYQRQIKTLQNDKQVNSLRRYNLKCICAKKRRAAKCLKQKQNREIEKFKYIIRVFRTSLSIIEPLGNMSA